MLVTAFLYRFSLKFFRLVIVQWKEIPERPLNRSLRSNLYPNPQLFHDQFGEVGRAEGVFPERVDTEIRQVVIIQIEYSHQRDLQYEVPQALCSQECDGIGQVGDFLPFAVHCAVGKFEYFRYHGLIFFDQIGDFIIRDKWIVQHFVQLAKQYRQRRQLLVTGK